MTALNRGTPHALYRFFAADDTLLYVGLTMDPGNRWKAHSKDKPWWLDVARITVEHYPSREAVEAAEIAAIRAERPRHNITHNRPSSVRTIRPRTPRIATRCEDWIERADLEWVLDDVDDVCPVISNDTKRSAHHDQACAQRFAFAVVHGRQGSWNVEVSATSGWRGELTESETSRLSIFVSHLITAGRVQCGGHGRNGIYLLGAKLASEAQAIGVVVYRLAFGDSSPLEAAITALQPPRHAATTDPAAPTFKAWLRTYRKADTAIGDLARDVAQDRNWPRNRPETLGRLRAHLSSHGACDEALTTLNAAWEQWLAATVPQAVTA